MKLYIDEEIKFEIDYQSCNFIDTLKEMSVYHNVKNGICTVRVQKITLAEEDMIELFEECFGGLTFTYANIGDQFAMRVTTEQPEL